MIELLIKYQTPLLKAFGETVLMMSIALVVSLILGGLLGLLLVITRKDGLIPQPVIYLMSNIYVTIVRSFPYILFVVFMMPVTRFIIGFTLGTIPASIPLSLVGVAIFARYVEQSLLEIPQSLTDTALTMGAKPQQIVRHFYLVEARSSLIHGFTATFISLLSYSSVMGVVSGGGLGDFAMIHGYHNHNYELMTLVVIMIIIIVQIIQWFGYALARKLDKS